MWHKGHRYQDYSYRILMMIMMMMIMMTMTMLTIMMTMIIIILIVLPVLLVPWCAPSGLVVRLLRLQSNLLWRQIGEVPLWAHCDGSLWRDGLRSQPLARWTRGLLSGVQRAVQKM